MNYTVKKGLGCSHPQPGCHLPNSSWPGIIYPVPGRFGQIKSRYLLNFVHSVCKNAGWDSANKLKFFGLENINYFIF